jgi:hypothetical protein
VSEYRVIRIKNVWLVVVGFCTFPKIIFLAVPLVVLAEPDETVALRLPAVPVLTAHVPEIVLEVNVEEDAEKPVGVVQLPEAVVQACARNDWNVAVVAVVKARV